MNWKTYNELIKEHFDIHDRENRKILLSLNEADQNKVMMSLAGKLYSKIVEKVDDIDYGGVPASKGDITKIPNYMNMKECLDIIRELVIEYNESPDCVDTVLKSIDNLKDSKNMWEKAFMMNCELPMVFYNNIALAIVSSVSLLLANCIEFIKDPVSGSFNATLDKSGLAKSKNHLLFKNLEQFNAAYKKGDVKKVMEVFMNGTKKVKESSLEFGDNEAITEEVATTIIAGVFIGATIIILLKLILSILQELVQIFYCTKQNISDYFAYQADAIMLNAENLKLSVTKTQSERDKIYKKQVKVAERYKKWSNIFAIKFKNAENQSIKLTQTEKKKYNVKDVTTELPASASDSIF